jgi:hypothetical protein
VDDYFAGAVQRTPVSAAPTYPPAYPPYPSPPVHPPYPGAPQQPWPYAAPTSSTGRTVLIGLLAAFVGLIVVGILAAIAIPVFLNQRNLARHTTVSVPAQVAGLPRATDAVGLAAESRLGALPGPGDHVAGAYGSTGTRVAVGAAAYHLSFKDQDEYLSSAVAEARTQDVQLAKVAPGTLGGHLSCGSSRVGTTTICVFADGGSYGIVVVTGSVDDPVGTARAAREAFVHRA